MSKEIKFIEIFTDGACKGNPGIGGWGAILIYQDHNNYYMWLYLSNLLIYLSHLL